MLRMKVAIAALFLGGLVRVRVLAPATQAHPCSGCDLGERRTAWETREWLPREVPIQSRFFLAFLMSSCFADWQSTQEVGSFVDCTIRSSQE